ncbi:DUF4188 domain-containing protein [Ktedonospora formicarum]|uniref:Transcriptional regulator n=1 Tax=Ktedonospora formicarum TaxID=2778364 RepID=A0A8J3I6C4_9CHLR|nr:DUF4188 domain-containing protein [Ktedonospora formicarum]GHO47918.1 transcriptional regulator [Ktedonospora formicarum]
MAEIIKERMTAEMEGEFVVFMIGMRVNQPWKFWKWLPVSRAMPKMLRELSKHPELGLLHYHTYFTFPYVTVIQYWRSFDALVSYAGNKDAGHFPAWVDFNRKVGSNGSVGIWHETYRVEPGAFESVYNNMPAFGLAAAGKAVPAVGRRSTAAGRMKSHSDQE